nr:tetratricopeptide repeat protein [Rhodoferax sp.]
MRLNFSTPRFQRLAVRPLVAALGTVLTLFCATSLHAEPSGEIKDPHYGDVLFQYFQDHYFSAATTLMVSQHFDRVAHHSEEAEVLRGGILLSYGLHREAGDIFTRLIALGATPTTRDRAWYFLAKIRYQRGYLNEAQDAMAQIGTALAPELKEERILLQANLQMARGDYSGAANTLSAVDSKAPSARYLRFNLGVALIKAGQAERGTAVLDELGRAPAEDEEYRGLRDRANLALGFAAMADNEPKAARNYLERVRLKSLQANKALLGLGWAAASMKEPGLALVPWMELTGRDVQDSAVLEAHIAVPYAYAELGAYGQSAKGYELAVATFTRENTALNESIAAINTGKLVEALVDSNPGQEMGWFWGVRELPDMPHAAHLSHVLAQHEFQEALKNYRDLIFLTKNLQEWREKLSVFDDMLANRRKAFAERLPVVRARASEIGIAPLRQRFDTATNMVAAGANAADGVAFADAKQLDLMARVANVQTVLQTAPDSAEIATARERARLASGALTWQLAQDYPARVWQAKQQLQSISDELATAQRLDAALAQAQRDEPARFEIFDKRIAAISPVLDAMVPRLAALTRTQKQAVQGIAVAELTRQQERLGTYSTQARFALAQLYDRGTDRATDRAASAKEADHAKQP